MHADGEGGNTRSAELLQPLQMHLLEIHAAVVPAVASLDTTPMETITALADSAAAAANLQKVVGPFVDSLSDGALHCITRCCSMQLILLFIINTPIPCLDLPISAPSRVDFYCIVVQKKPGRNQLSLTL